MRDATMQNNRNNQFQEYIAMWSDELLWIRDGSANCLLRSFPRLRKSVVTRVKELALLKIRDAEGRCD